MRRRGYIKLRDFGENTDQELGQALKTLSSRGMKKLVFDLRGNPAARSIRRFAWPIDSCLAAT
jgi:hypothetical protein